MTRHNARKGFTVVEMLSALALIVIIITVAYNFYILAKDVWLYVLEEGRMQAKASYILEAIAHGPELDHKGLLEAQDINTPPAGVAGASLSFVDQDDDTLDRTIYFSGADSEVRYVDESSNDTILDIDDRVDNDVQTLLFTRPADNDNLIYINIVLQKTFAVNGKVIQVDVTTAVKARNMR